MKLRRSEAQAQASSSLAKARIGIGVLTRRKIALGTPCIAAELVTKASVRQ